MPPETKPEQDPEVVALANAIGDDPNPDVEAPQPPVPAPGEVKEPPEGGPETPEETPEEAEERVRREAAGEPPKVVEPGEGDEDPLKDIGQMKPEDALRALLGHTTLGPKLQHWSDTAGNTRIAQAVEKERVALATSAKRTAEEEQADAHFASMSKEEVAEEISDSPDSAVAYAQYQARLKAGAGGGTSPEAIAKASEVFAVSAQVLLNTQMLEGSELPPEVKDRLKPENFNKPGGEGLNAWGEQIFSALVDFEAEKKAQGLHESTWDAYKQEHLAEVDGERPDISGGRRTSALPDLITTETGALFEDAFKGRKTDKEGAK